MGKALSDLELLMGQIDESMEMTENFEKKINEKRALLKTRSEKGEDVLEIETDIANREADKKEFDEMTVNALKKAYKDLQTVRERELEEFKKEYEKRKQAQERRKERLAKYTKEFVSRSPEEQKSLARKITMVQAKIAAEDKSMQTFLSESVATRARTDRLSEEYGKKIEDYATRLGVKEEVMKTAQTRQTEPRDKAEKEIKQNVNRQQGAKPKENGEQVVEPKESGEQEAEQPKTQQPTNNERQTAGTNGTVRQRSPFMYRGQSSAPGKNGEQVEKKETETEKPESENPQPEERKNEDENVSKIVKIKSITFSAKDNSYTYVGLDETGKEITGKSEALKGKDRKEYKGTKAYRKADPNIVKIFGKLDPSNLRQYRRALEEGREIKDVKVSYDFREDPENKLGLFAKLRAHRDARHNKNLATIINKKGVAKLGGQTVELLEKGSEQQVEHSEQQVENENEFTNSIRMFEDPTKAAIESYRKNIEQQNDPARNVKNYDGQSK